MWIEGKSKQLGKFVVTCEFDEVLLLKKKFASVAATSATTLHWISDSRMDLVQMVVYNFDTDIASQNRNLSLSLSLSLSQ